MWTEIKTNLLAIKQSEVYNAIPHKYSGDAKGHSVKECLDWIKENHEGNFPSHLIPIYGGFEIEQYEGSADFLLINTATGKFYEIHGSHCSCYGFEGQFIPEECPIEYLAKGKVWEEAYPTVLEVVEYFEKNPIN